MPIETKENHNDGTNVLEHVYCSLSLTRVLQESILKPIKHRFCRNWTAERISVII